MNKLKPILIVISAFFSLLPVLSYAETVLPPALRAADEAYQRGDIGNAAKQWEILLENKDLTPTLQVEVMSRLATAYQRLGMHREVLLTLEEALILAEDLENPVQQAMLSAQASDAWLVSDDLEVATSLANDSVAYAEKSGDKQILAMSLNNLGNVLAVLELYEYALPTFEESQDLANAVGDTVLAAKAMLNHFKASLYFSPLEDVLQHLNRAREQVAVLPSSADKVDQLLTLGNLIKFVLKDADLAKNLAQKKQVLRAAFDIFTEAGKLAEELGVARGASLAYGRIAELYEEDKRYEEALSFNRRSVFFARQGSFADVLYLWEWQQGRLFNAQGNRLQAIKAYEAAAMTLKPVRQNLSVGYRMSGLGFDEVVRPVYYEWADLLLREAADTADVEKNQALLRAARDAVETLKVAELQDYFGDECVAEFQASRSKTTLDEVMAKTAIVYPVPLADRLVVLLTADKKITQHTVSVTKKELMEKTLDFRLRLQTRPENRFLAPAMNLYDWLVRPLLPRLQAAEVDTLIFVMDGALRTIPPATMFDGKQFLVENYAIAVAPGLTLVDPKAIDWAKAELMLVGLSAAVQEYPPLPNVVKELEVIQDLAKRGDKILNQEYTFASFSNMLKGKEYSVIHLATHGEFDSDPEHTYLLTYNDKMTLDRLQEVIGLGNFRKNPVELLTLSACRTAVGDDRAALGLAGVAVKAGARSAIATLWFVDDEATAFAMKDFYRRVLEDPSLTKAKALQQVQLKLIERDRYWHPIYWGPFLLIGNWL